MAREHSFFFLLVYLSPVFILCSLPDFHPGVPGTSTFAPILVSIITHFRHADFRSSEISLRKSHRKPIRAEAIYLSTSYLLKLSHYFMRVEKYHPLR